MKSARGCWIAQESRAPVEVCYEGIAREDDQRVDKMVHTEAGERTCARLCAGSYEAALRAHLLAHHHVAGGSWVGRKFGPANGKMFFSLSFFILVFYLFTCFNFKLKFNFKYKFNIARLNAKAINSQHDVRFILFIFPYK